MKKLIAIGMTVFCMASVLAGCGSSSSGSTSASGEASTSAAASTSETTASAESTESTGSDLGAITVVSREDGSGTRGAFVELFGIEGDNGDMTVDTAEITNSTAVMMTTIAGNTAAIGYISLGSLDDSVKAVTIDGVEATTDNVKSGDYKVARPFNIVTNGELSEAAQDFVNFIMSDEGQAVVEENGYISQGSNGAYTASGISGEISVAGSSSVTPVMEKLSEAYRALNPDVTIEVQMNDSTTGVTSAIDGICDIGMASRELKDSELEAGVTPTVIAMDGIAVIVNNENPVANLTTEQVGGIFTGEITDWADVQ